MLSFLIVSELSNWNQILYQYKSPCQSNNPTIIFFLQLSETSLPQALTNRVTFLSILESALDSSTSEGDRSSESFGVATMIPEPPKFMDYDTIVDESAYKADDGIEEILNAKLHAS